LSEKTAIERVAQKVRAKHLRMKPPISEAELKTFEQSNRLILPKDYREFLLHVANGGQGPPDYGLCGFGEVPSDFNQPRPDLSRPFPFTKLWIWEDGDTSEEGTEDDVNCGVLILGTDGCALYCALVVRGPDEGKIWMIADVGITPLRPPMMFLEWYEAWLDGKRDWWK
jgi:SMI1 / KNR4 family (SUKH-1)